MSNSNSFQMARQEESGVTSLVAPNAIEVRNLSKFYKYYTKPTGILRELITRQPQHEQVWALKDVSFSVPKGEVIGIIGRNGAGKSTLLKLLAGTLDASSGDLTVNGKISAILELGTGFHPDFTGRENVRLGGLTIGMTHDEIERKLPSIIEFSGLEDVIDRPFKTYSSGMQSRLTFATAISVDPDIFIVDEALAAGDAYFVSKSLARIREICKSGATVLFVSHGTSLVAQLCDRAIWLENGSLRAIGDALSVVRDYDYSIHQELNGSGELTTIQVPTFASAAVAEPAGTMLEQPSLESFEPIQATGLNEQATPELSEREAADDDTSKNSFLVIAPEPAEAPPTELESEPASVEVPVSIAEPTSVVPLPAPIANDAPLAPLPDTAVTTGRVNKTIFRKGPVFITKIEFLDKDGKPSMIFRRWESLTVRVWYEVQGPLPTETLGLAIAANRQSDMLSLFQANTNNLLRDSERQFYATAPFRQRPARNGYIQGKIDPLQLGEGLYLFSIGILPNIPNVVEFYEYHHFTYEISIMRDGSPLQGVAFAPLIEWEHQASQIVPN